MKKQLILGMTLLTFGGVLAGCGEDNTAQIKSSLADKNKHASDKAEDSNMSSKVVREHVKPKPKVKKHPHIQSSKMQATDLASASLPTPIWNNEKSRLLEQFVIQWGETSFNPAQEYQEYYPNPNGHDFLGYSFPEDLNNIKVAVNDQPVSMNISKDGTNKYDYNVVAIFSDAGLSQSTVGVHLYMMTIHNGQPVVLVTQQNQGTPDKMLHFSPTKNTDIEGKFDSLVHSNVDASVEKMSIINYSGGKLDYRQIGLMLFKAQNPAVDLVDEATNNQKFILTRADDAYARFTIQSDTNNQITFTFDNSGVTIWNNDNSSRKVSYAQLVAQTYNTSAKQASLNRAAVLVNINFGY